MLSGLAHGDYRPLRFAGLGLWMFLQDAYTLALPPEDRPMPR
jgi:hypothetical protein